MGSKGVEEISNMTTAALGGQPAADLVVVDDEADGVLLVVGEIGDCGGEFTGEIKLAG